MCVHGCVVVFFSFTVPCVYATREFPKSAVRILPNVFHEGLGGEGYSAFPREHGEVEAQKGGKAKQRKRMPCTDICFLRRWRCWRK